MGREGEKDPGKAAMGRQGYDDGGGDEDGGGCVDGCAGDTKSAFLDVALLHAVINIYLV